MCNLSAGLSKRRRDQVASIARHSGAEVVFPAIDGRYISLDIETDGLNPYRGHRAFCFAWSTEQGEFGWTYKTRAALKWLKSLTERKDKEFVFHNGKFDIKMLGFDGIEFPRERTHCTLILSKLVNSLLPSHDLRSLAIRFAGADPFDKDTIEQWVAEEKRRTRRTDITFKDAPRELVSSRNLWDAQQTTKLFALFKRQVDATCPELYRTEQRLMFECIDIENYGVMVDLTKVKQLRAKSIEGITKLQANLNRLVCPLTIVKQKTRRRKGVKYKEAIEIKLDSFNANSPIEMEAAFNAAGIELRFKTKPKKNRQGEMRGGGRWSFDEYAMIQYVSPPLQSVIRRSGEEGWLFGKFYHEVKKAIRENKLSEFEMLPPFILKLRELQKMVSTYYDNLIADAVDVQIEPNGREVGIIHCKFNQAEAKTGRFSSSEPNLQNMPRLLGPRQCFVPRRGRVNWHFDYSQVEMKFFGHFAKDPKMAQAIKDDIHRHTASVINKIPKDQVTSEQRKRAKKVNFGPLYGSGADTLAEALTKDGFPTQGYEARKWLIAYHAEFPSVRRTTNGFKADLSRKGYVENPFGRRYHIPVKFAYKALNYMCQGTSADLMKRAMVDICHWLRENGLKSRLILTVHDELVIEMPRSEQRIVVSAVIRLMEELRRFYLPIEVDAEVVTKRWSEKVEPKDVGIDWDEAVKLARSGKPIHGVQVTPWSQRNKQRKKSA